VNDLFTPRDAQNYRVFSAWMAAAAVIFIAATFLIEARLVDPPAGWVLPLVGAIAGVGALRAYVVFLRHADELLRKIHLDALAFGFGCGLVFMPVYRLCERLGAPKLDSVDPIIVFIAAWIIAQLRGYRKYSTAEAQ
jgi:hypothetical protein